MIRPTKQKGGDKRSASEIQLEKDLLGIGVDIPVYSPRGPITGFIRGTEPKPSKKHYFSEKI